MREKETPDRGYRALRRFCLGSGPKESYSEIAAHLSYSCEKRAKNDVIVFLSSVGNYKLGLDETCWASILL